MAYGRLFYCNITKGTIGAASGGSGGGTNPFGLLRLGDILKLSLRMQKEIGGRVVDSNDPIQSVKITLGKKDARPTGGFFRLKFQGHDNHFTPPLPKNASAEEIEKALNDLTEEILGEISTPENPINRWKVTYRLGSYIANIPDGLGYFPIDVQENKLTPSSFVTLKAWEQDGLKYNEIRLTQAPCVTTSDFSLVVPQQPYITRILAGQYPSETGTGVDEVQSLRIPAEFRGNFQVKRELAGSQPLGTNPDAAIVKEALDLMSKSLGGTYTVTTPTTTGDKQFNITFGGKLSASPQPLLGITVIDNPQGDLTFTMPLNTTSLYEAIRDGNGTANLILEGEALVTDAVSGSPNQETTKITLFSIPITIQNRLSDPQASALTDTNWAIPPDPVNYIPYSPTQVLFGQQHYQCVIPSEATVPTTEAPDFANDIQHNLNTGNEAPFGLHVTIRENQGQGRFLRDGEYEIQYMDNNRIRIHPRMGEGGTSVGGWMGKTYIVTISTAGPKSAFQAHTHSITEITGLSQSLQDLSNQVAEIIAVMPVVSNIISQKNQTAVEFKTPINKTFFLLGCSKYKDGKKIPPFAQSTEDYLVDLEGIWKLDKLPISIPKLLPAIHDASVTETSTAPTRLSPVGVYKNTGTRAWKLGTEVVLQNEYAGVSNGSVYKVWKPDSKPSFYATEYEKTLFTWVCNEQVLPVGRFLQVKFGVGAQSYLSNVAGKFILILEHGPFVEEEASSYGPNLERLSFDKQIVRTPIIISPQPQQFACGIRISNTLQAIDPDAQPIEYEQVIKQDKFIMGLWSGATTVNGVNMAPATESFALRARISQFDIENTENASGYIHIALLGGLDESNSSSRLEYTSPNLSTSTIQ